MQYLLLAILSLWQICEATVYPIQFAVSETKIVKEIPLKDRDFAFIVPLKPETYIYKEEGDYYRDYQRSYFAVTCKKGGWDCLRHYEILANGCIPYFVDLDKADSNLMIFLPKELILEAMHLEGVSYLSIDHTVFDKKKYYEILNKILEHTRKHLTAKNIAQYVLDTVGYSGSGKILFLSQDIAPDYLRCCTLIGLKELLQDRVIDYPKIPHIYKSYSEDTKKLYGLGFTYSKVVDDPPIDRSQVEQQIMRKEFELIIYGSVHRGLFLHDLVTSFYEPDKIIYFCGEDDHKCPYIFSNNLFLREFNGY